MITVEKLNAFGADTAEGLARCCGMEALYLRLVATVPDDANFKALSDALESKDISAAFTACHTLKGALGNLSLTPMYEIVSDMTEKLRSGSDEGCDEQCSRLCALRDELQKLCSD